MTDDQLSLLPGPKPKRAPRPVGVAERLPVARVLVDVPLAHLDKPFDYLVPDKLDADVVPGSRVRIKFAGQDVDGFVLERVAASDHPGRLMPLRRSVSAESVLSPAIAELSAQVAARYAGTRSDVLRLAVPPRHAATEKEASKPGSPAEAGLAAAREAWAVYGGLPDRLAAGESPCHVWTALPGADWPTLLAHAAAATAGSGRGALLCVSDQRDLARLDSALKAVLGPGRHVLLTAELGPATRYRSFLAVSRGAVRVVAGTRAAAFAPVHDLGLVAIWDDGDDLYAEPRAPYCHTREVLLLRAHHEGTAALLGAYAQSVEAASLLETGWAAPLTADAATTRKAAPVVLVSGDDDRDLERDPFARVSRVPAEAMAVVRRGVEQGPVLVQTPRLGYVTALVCEACRAPVRCGACTGPMSLPGKGALPTCRWCGQVDEHWRCAHCGGRGLRAPVLGDARTAEELGRAFPGVPVVRSSGDHVLASVADRPSIVVATPGAEPVAAYCAALLLDTWIPLARPVLRAGEEALRRWTNAVALVRPGGEVFVVGEPSAPSIQALVRWDAAGYAARELEERRTAHLPPASRLATVTGAEGDVAAFVGGLSLPPGGELLGPAPVAPGRDGEPQVRAVLRVPRRFGAALSRELVEQQGVRAAHKLPAVRVQVDPMTLE